MRIGIDARLLHYRQEGIGQYIINLLDGMAEAGTRDEVTVFYKGSPPALSQGTGSFAFRPLITPSHHRLEQMLLPLELAPHKLHVLHSPDFIPPLRRLFRSVITIHDLAFLIYPQLLTAESKLYYGQVRQAAARADHIITPSESTKRDVVDMLEVRAEKVSVISEAANPLYRQLDEDEIQSFLEQTPALVENLKRAGIECGSDDDQGIVLFVSTIEPRKNLTTLIRAFSRLTARPATDFPGRRPKLLIVGKPGWLYKEVFELVRRLGIEDSIFFLGGVTPPELLVLYNMATVLACPSLYEGFGLPPLEAMACGTPVAVSNVSSLPEVVGDAGLLLAPLDVDQWASGLVDILGDASLRAELVRRGLERAGQFSWRGTARQTAEVYRKVVARDGR